MANNTIKFLLLIAIVWIWLPTGYSDIFIIPWIISKIGFNMYIMISIIMVIYLYKTIDGKTIQDKINTVKDEIGGFVK